jgi:ATP-dependent exoDNAse (exonuclease V) beta subunit
MTMAGDSPSSPILDADERVRALAADASFIVQAPAGSGKTELLIQRYLTLLTLAAARSEEPSEQYLRDRYQLARTVLDRSDAEGWNILDSPHRLEINTIDSLCAKLTRSLPLMAAFGGSPTVTDDAVPFYRDAVRRTLKAAAGDPSLSIDLATLLARREMRIGQVEEQLITMLGKRDQWTHEALQARSQTGAEELLDRIEAGIATAMGESLDAVRRHFGDGELRSIHELAVATRAACDEKGRGCDWPTLGSADMLGDGIESIAAWKQVRAIFLTKSTSSLRSEKSYPGANKGTPQQELWLQLRSWFESHDARTSEEIIEALRALDNVPETAAFEPTTREAMLAMFRLLFRAHAELWSLFLEIGVTDFVEMSRRAVLALGSPDAPSDLLQRLDREVEHLLVDEFQDTSVSQCDLIRRLTTGWVRGDGKTLFLVGDPMQSIYRFRKAEVGLFLQARGSGGLFDNIDLEFLQLSVNFRSQPLVIDWVNERFSVLMGDADDMARAVVGYAPSSARPGAAAGAAPEVVLWNDAAAVDTAGTNEAEAEGLAALIDEELLPAARARNGRVAVLVQVRKHTALLLAALRVRGVAYVSEGLDTLVDRAVVQDLRSLTRFLLHRGDRLCGLALLRSPLVGLSLADLAAFVEPDVMRVLTERSADSRADRGGVLQSVTQLLGTAVDRLSDDGRLRAERFLHIMSTIRAEVGRRRVCELVEGAWVALGGPAVAVSSGAADAQAFFTLLAAMEEAGTIDLTELERRLEKTDAPSGGDSRADLSVMTMHAAKGLEFDTVVLLGLGRVPGGGSNEPLVFETEPRSGDMNALALEKARGADHDDDLKYALIRDRESARDRAENLRLLYVGSTRAKQRLLLSAAEPRLDDAGEYKPARRSLLYRIALADGLEAARRCEVTVAGFAAAVRMPRLRADASSIAVPPSAPIRLRHERRPSDVAGEIAPEALTVVNLRRNAGIVAHSFLERIALEGVANWRDEETRHLERARARIRRELAREGTAEEQLDDGEEVVIRALRGTLGDHIGLWLLTEHDAARCEWKLSSWDTGDDSKGNDVDQTNASLDRSFVDGGTRWIIDYKIIEPPVGQSEDAFIADRTRHYRDQLESYAELVRELEPERPIRLGLYFPLLARFSCWDPGSTETAASPWPV